MNQSPSETAGDATPGGSAGVALRMVDVSKSFPGVLALDRVSLTVHAGEIHGLIGENGAGKTTLMRIAYGFYRPDSGTIEVDGEPVELATPRTALELGIGMVHQHSLLVDSFTVAENLMLGGQKGLSRLPRKQVERELRGVAEQFHLPIDPTSRVASLGVAGRQQVEILRVLHAEARVMILDEPTAVLTPQDANRLLDDLARYRDLGKTVVIITHKLPEVMRVTDRVTVLRGGEVVHVGETEDTDPAELARHMVGRPVELRAPRSGRGAVAPEAEVVLDVSGVRATNDMGDSALNGVDLEVRRGEIVGLAGVAGNGISELIECIAGLRDCVAGTVTLLGEDVTRSTPAARRSLGLRHVPEDRLDRGANPEASLAENLILGRHRDDSLRRGPVLVPARVSEVAVDAIERFTIRAPGPHVRAGALSGGNLQKAIIAREFRDDAEVVLAAQPTRGVDVGAASQIKQELSSLAATGAAVLVSSVELVDLMDLCDRIVVLYRGSVAGVLSHREATEEAIGLLMSGGNRRDI